jgi:gliding motility-associated-like protein
MPLTTITLRRVSTIFLFFVFLLNTYTYAQNQNSQWRFGYGGGLDFTSGNPVNVTGASIQTPEGGASIADRNTGALLFYTDGVTVWDANNQQMPNGFGLLGGSIPDLSSTSAAVIVPIPGSNTQFYIITIDQQFTNNGVNYSVVDMSLNGGLGDVIPAQKNIFLVSTTSEKLQVVPSSDLLGYWLITHDNPGNGFLAFKITAAGINTTPIISLIGGSQGNGAGHFKVNKQFNKIAMGDLFGGNVELFDFNNTTGVVSNAVIWDFVSNTLIYGVEFSPDGSKLYVSNIDQVYQYDISSGNAATIQATVYNVSAGLPFYQAASLQLAVNDKIYITAGSIDVINCPDAAGAACNFQTNAIAGQTGGGGYGLPQWVYYPDELPFILEEEIVAIDTCLDTGAQFTAISNDEVQSVSWNFGDPASGANNTASGFNVSHSFSQIGTFTVTAVLFKECENDTLTTSITIINCCIPPPAPTITGDLNYCEGEIPSPLTANSNQNGNFTWYSEAGTINVLANGPSFTPNITTGSVNYYVTVNVNDCESLPALATINFQENTPLTITSDQGLTPCEGQLVQLTYSPNTNVQWSNGSTNASISVSNSGTYSVTPTTNEGCFTQGNITIQFTPIPVLNILGPVLSCPNSEIQLSVTGANSYEWSNGETTESILINSNEISEISVTGFTNNCSATAQYTINLFPTIPVFAGDDKEILPEATFTLSASGGYGNYVWSPAEFLNCEICPSTSGTVVNDTEFIVSSQSPDGCLVSDTVKISIDSTCTGVYIPSAFTPNESEPNNTFCVVSECIHQMDLKIYNRWGQVVFISKDISVCWDGTINGKPAQEDVYTYKFAAMAKDGQMFERFGKVVLIR